MAIERCDFNKEHIYYILEQDQLWISWCDIGDFVSSDYKNYPLHYIYIDEL